MQRLRLTLSLGLALEALFVLGGWLRSAAPIRAGPGSLSAVGPAFTPSRTGDVVPGFSVTYLHTLTSDADLPQTITLTVATMATEAGYTVTVTPVPTVTVVSLTGEAVVVTVTAPETATLGAQVTAVITATDGEGRIAVVTDTTTVVAFNPVAPALEPERQGSALPGRTITYYQTLINHANVPLRFALQSDNVNGYTVTVAPTETALLLPAATAGPAGWSRAVIAVTVAVPPDVPTGTVQTTVVTATAVGYPALWATATQITVADWWRLYLPLVQKPPSACAAIPGASYSSLSVVGDGGPNPDAEHDAGYNIGLLGYDVVAAEKTFTYYGPTMDLQAPQFYFLFEDHAQRNVVFSQVYNLRNGDGTPVQEQWPVTYLGLGVATNEVIGTPDSGYDIQYGYDAMVIYASQQRIAINYGRNDTLAGYTVYIDGICVEPSLLALYQQLNAAGRNDLPVVQGGQPLGRAWSTEVRIAIRDTGRLLDPRSQDDWWRLR